MNKSTRKIILFIALFSIFSSASTLIYKVIFHINIPWYLIAGGLLSGFIVAYLVRSYDNDDDFMPKQKNTNKLK